MATAAELPVARVVVDLPLAHLDHPFDYTVPAPMADAAQPGVRVRVRFAGQDVDAFVIERLAASDHPGRLSPLRRVVSPERVLTPDVLRLARAVADRYAGTLGDVLRLAIPPRHAATEQAARTDGVAAAEVPAELAPLNAPEPGPWTDYPAGRAFLARLADGAPRAVWTPLPGPDWATALAVAAGTAAAAGRGAVLVLPDRRDVDTVEAALVALLGPGRHARLEADLGPSARYAAFLACLRGDVRIAIGTRSAAFAPVADLGLAVIWDDGDDVHAEPRAPYPHAREVLAVRAAQSGAAMLLGGWSVSVEAARLLAEGWARPIEAERTVRRGRWARVTVASDAEHADADPRATSARIPPAAWRAVQQGLAHGPVLVQVPRSGYLPSVACATCRTPARCPHCAGPVRLGSPASAPGAPGAEALPSCGWCARVLAAWTCPHCQGRRLRALRVGVQRTAEELGRAFPASPVVVSRPDRALPPIGARPAIVLATPGVEPPAAEGYACAVLLDGDVLLSRADLRAGEEALRRWLAATGLVRGADRGGVVVVCADASLPAVQALVRLDPAWFAERELAERTELGLPPAVGVASLTGSPQAVASLLAAARLPDSATVLGPVPVETSAPGDEPVERFVVRTPPGEAAALAKALHDASAVRSARRDPGPVRVQLDPRDLG